MFEETRTAAHETFWKMWKNVKKSNKVYVQLYTSIPDLAVLSFHFRLLIINRNQSGFFISTLFHM